VGGHQHDTNQQRADAANTERGAQSKLIANCSTQRKAEWYERERHYLPRRRNAPKHVQGHELLHERGLRYQDDRCTKLRQHTGAGEYRRREQR
jgi:hypothetical protein